MDQNRSVPGVLGQDRIKWEIQDQAGPGPKHFWKSRTEPDQDQKISQNRGPHQDQLGPVGPRSPWSVDSCSLLARHIFGWTEFQNQIKVPLQPSSDPFLGWLKLELRLSSRFFEILNKLHFYSISWRYDIVYTVKYTKTIIGNIFQVLLHCSFRRLLFQQIRYFQNFRKVHFEFLSPSSRERCWTCYSFGVLSKCMDTRIYWNRLFEAPVDSVMFRLQENWKAIPLFKYRLGYLTFQSIRISLLLADIIWWKSIGPIKSFDSFDE